MKCQTEEIITRTDHSRGVGLLKREIIDHPRGESILKSISELLSFLQFSRSQGTVDSVGCSVVAGVLEEVVCLHVVCPHHPLLPQHIATGVLAPDHHHHPHSYNNQSEISILCVYQSEISILEVLKIRDVII